MSEPEKGKSLGDLGSSVVECLTRDRGAAGSSLTDIVLCLGARTLILA